jgi:hypothetical protein
MEGIKKQYGVKEEEEEEEEEEKEVGSNLATPE